MRLFFPLVGRVLRRSGWVRVATVGLLLVLAGCATVPPPDNSMNRAQAQLQAARDADAADYAPVDLGFAQDKFQQAQAAMAARKYANAADLSEESRADAELAQAKARLGAARSQIQSKVQENTRLRNLDDQNDGNASQPAGQTAAPSANDLPNAALPDMPAPASSVLVAPGAGFQTVPDNSNQPADNQPADPSQETQPVPQGGQL
ncbi:MAG: DUF4398 domain-containing protein [Rhodanobacter sp.]